MVEEGVAAPVSLVVVEEAHFEIVLFLLVTFVNFENLQELFENLMVFFRVVLQVGQLT